MALPPDEDAMARLGSGPARLGQSPRLLGRPHHGSRRGPMAAGRAGEGCSALPPAGNSGHRSHKRAHHRHPQAAAGTPATCSGLAGINQFSPCHAQVASGLLTTALCRGLFRTVTCRRLQALPALSLLMTPSRLVAVHSVGLLVTLICREVPFVSPE